MKKLDIVIPTYGREQKLLETLISIRDARMMLHSVKAEVHLFFSNPQELERVREHEKGKQWIVYHLLGNEFLAARFWNAYLASMEADALCYLTDDIQLDYMCLSEGWNHLSLMGLDGVVGFKIENALDGQPARAAFGMIGKPFVDRFPNKEVFCPEYSCFYLDEELEMFSSKIGRFIFCEQARLRHSHPDFTGDGPDKTHIHHRRHKFRDIIAYKLRRKQKLIWGESFEKIGPLFEKKEEALND